MWTANQAPPRPSLWPAARTATRKRSARPAAARAAPSDDASRLAGCRAVTRRHRKAVSWRLHWTRSRSTGSPFGSL